MGRLEYTQAQTYRFYVPNIHSCIRVSNAHIVGNAHTANSVMQFKEHSNSNNIYKKIYNIRVAQCYMRFPKFLLSFETITLKFKLMCSKDSIDFMFECHMQSLFFNLSLKCNYCTDWTKRCCWYGRNRDNCKIKSCRAESAGTKRDRIYRERPVTSLILCIIVCKYILAWAYKASKWHRRIFCT